MRRIRPPPLDRVPVDGLPCLPRAGGDDGLARAGNHIVCCGVARPTNSRTRASVGLGMRHGVLVVNRQHGQPGLRAPVAHEAIAAVRHRRDVAEVARVAVVRMAEEVAPDRQRRVAGVAPAPDHARVREQRRGDARWRKFSGFLSTCSAAGAPSGAWCMRYRRAAARGARARSGPGLQEGGDARQPGIVALAQARVRARRSAISVVPLRGMPTMKTGLNEASMGAGGTGAAASRRSTCRSQSGRDHGRTPRSSALPRAAPARRPARRRSRRVPCQGQQRRRARRRQQRRVAKQPLEQGEVRMRRVAIALRHRQLQGDQGLVAVDPAASACSGRRDRARSAGHSAARRRGRAGGRRRARRTAPRTAPVQLVALGLHGELHAARDPQRIAGRLPGAVRDNGRRAVVAACSRSTWAARTPRSNRRDAVARGLRARAGRARRRRPVARPRPGASPARRVRRVAAARVRARARPGRSARGARGRPRRPAEGGVHALEPRAQRREPGLGGRPAGWAWTACTRREATALALWRSAAAYFSSCVIIAGFGLPQPVTRSNAVPAV